jgi:thiopurine S-methyltransferase
VQPEFWLERWRMGQTGFHQARVDRLLEKYWAQLQVPTMSRVFVPLCGKSLDLVWLHERGHFVSGVELSVIALESFCMEQGILAKRRKLAAFDAYEAENFQLFCGDFFALTPALLGRVAAVYDRAALISWAPELRAAYVDRIASLTHAGTQMLLVTVEYLQSQMTGPPFSITGDDVQRLYSSHFTIRELGRSDILASEDRLRARGLTALHEVCYALTRL